MRRHLTLWAVLALALFLSGCSSCATPPSVLDLSTPWGDLDLFDSRPDRVEKARAARARAAAAEAAARAARAAQPAPAPAPAVEPTAGVD